MDSHNPPVQATGFLKSLERYLPWGLAALLLGMLLASAWICDDAYISFRSVRNFVEGYGLTYNPIERVQSFTHPLWVLVLIPFYAVSGSIYWSAILLSLGLTAAAFGWFARSQKPSLSGWALLLGLPVFSQAFLDYSSSGLENPLSHFLVAVFVAEWCGRKRLSWLALATALVMTNRFDLGLMVLPALAWAFWRNRSWKSVRQVVLGFLPFLLWEGFSLFYYGFPFPNTAYAKLNTALPKTELIGQGFHYYGFTLKHDVVTLLTVFGGLFLVGWRRVSRLYPLAIGLGIYLLYILQIGGDFMGGRFFAAPFWMGLMLTVVVLKNWKKGHPEAGTWKWLPWGISALALAWTGLQFVQRVGAEPETNIINAHGVADERAFYGPATNPLKRLRHPEEPMFRWSEKGAELREQGTPVSLQYNMGFLGWEAGPQVHLVDHMALTDPLLARLPMVYDPNWRIGHFVRAIPAGYLESVGEYYSQIADTNLREYDRRLRWVTRGPIWDWNRLKQIVRFNTGMNNYLVDQTAYRFPITQSVALDKIDEPEESRFSLNDFQGLEVVLPQNTLLNSLRIGAGWGPEYQLLAVKGMEKVDEVVYDKAFRLNMEDHADFTITLEAGGAQADRLLIYPLSKLGDFPLALVQVK